MRHTAPNTAFPAGWLATLTLAVLLYGMAGAATAAGFEHIEVPVSGDEPPITAIIWSPCADSPGPVEQGPYVIQGVRDCDVSGNSLPLVVISHGQGGTMLGHHDTSAALADAGFIAVALNHPGDTFSDDSQAQQLHIFESRPRDVSRVISFMLDSWHSNEQLDGESIGIFGFSRGGYTALALLGAVPDITASVERLCPGALSFLTPQCRQIKAKNASVSPRPDPRIRAAVVVDPLNLFDTDGLKSVSAPVQLWASEKGGDGVKLAHIEEIRSALPQPSQYHVAKGAGHFAYLVPCPPAFKKTAPRICDDPEGFDRTAWHEQMNAAVITFFKQHLQSQAQ